MIAAVLALSACHKDSHGVEARGSAHDPAVALAPRDATPTVMPADAAVVSSVDLLRAVPSTIRVSSRVKNRKILPAHIADRDLGTAWNSATGQLVGAWVEVSADATEIDTVKITAGYTGQGPKGEDYFTMNPRIRSVKLDDNGRPLGTFPLDITKRDLQTIHVVAHDTLRITVAEIEPGSKPTWRETAVSELEVWGTPPIGWKPPKTPFVPNVVVDGEREDAPDPCEGADKVREAFIKEHEHDVYSGPGGEDHNYPPRCDGLELPPSTSQLPAPWSGANSGCDVGDEIYGPKTCTVQFKSGSRVAHFAVGNSMQSADIRVVSMEMDDVVPGGRTELVIKMRTPDGDVLGVCREEPVLACSEPVQVPDVRNLDWTQLAFEK